MIVCPWKELHRYASLLPGLEDAVKLVDSLEDLTPATYPLPEGNKVLIQQGITKNAEGALAEAHREYLDIQYILEGQETVVLEEFDAGAEMEHTRTAVEDADAMNVDQEYRLTLLELGISEADLEV